MRAKRLFFGFILIVTAGLFSSACDGTQETGRPTTVKPVCGDGKVTGGEKCDTAAIGKQQCQTSEECESQSNGCMKYALSGEACQSVCSAYKVTACANDDGCCPEGCTQNVDNDCPQRCGDGVVTGNESCDSRIPEGEPGACVPSKDACDAIRPTNSCAYKVYTGSVDDCTASCRQVDITECKDNDGCCLAGCNPGNDNDCAENVCGDGYRGPDESCDTGITSDLWLRDPSLTQACISQAECEAINTYNSCSKFVYSGSDCQSTCLEQRISGISECNATPDGCCPDQTCTSVQDPDCGKSEGKECTSDAACLGDLVCLIKDLKTQTGTCQKECTASPDVCGPDEFCTNVRWMDYDNRKYCLKTCSGSGDCSVDGESCQPAPSATNGETICFRDKYSANFGNDCNANWECGFEGRCDRQGRDGSFRGGDCYVPKWNDLKCPEGSVAHDFEGNIGELCVTACSQNSPCRDGYICNNDGYCATSSRAIDLNFICPNDEFCVNKVSEQDNRAYIGQGWTCRNVGTPREKNCVPPEKDESYATKKIGEPCSVHSECMGNDSMCYIYDTVRWLGFCAKECETDSSCPTGSVCAEMDTDDNTDNNRFFEGYGKVCLSQCNGNNGCLLRDFICDPAQHACVYKAPQINVAPETIGKTCNTDADCDPPEGFCLLGSYSLAEKQKLAGNHKSNGKFGFGICSAVCHRAKCPNGSVCISDRNSGNQGWEICLPDCNRSTGNPNCANNNLTCVSGLKNRQLPSGTSFDACWVQ